MLKRRWCLCDLGLRAWLEDVWVVISIMVLCNYIVVIEHDRRKKIRAP